MGGERRGVGAVRPAVLTRLIWVLAVLAAVTLPVGPAAAGGHRPRLVIDEGQVQDHHFAAHPVTGRPASLPEDEPYAPGGADAERCTEYGTCLEADLELRLPDDLGVRDVLLELGFHWDSSKDSEIGARLYAPMEGGGRRVVKGSSSTIEPGRTELILANPSSRHMTLQAWTARGEAVPFRLRAVLRVHDRTEEGPHRVRAAAPGAGAGEHPLEAPLPATSQASTASVGPAVPAAAGASQPPTPPAGALPPSERLQGLAATATGHDGPGTPPVGSLLLPALCAAALVIGTGAGVVRRRRALPRVPRLVDLPLSVKLVLPFALLIVITGAVGTVVTTRYLGARAAAEVDNTLLASGTAADAFLRDQEFLLLDAARYGANVEGMADAVAARDTEGTLRALSSVAAVHRSVDVVAAVGPYGSSIADLVRQGDQASPHEGADWSSVPQVGLALQGSADAAGDKRSGFVRTARAPLLVVAAPLRPTSPVGAVVVGVDADTLARQAAERAGAGVVLFDGAGRMLASSIDGFRLTEMAEVDRPAHERATVRGRSFAVRRQPLVLRGERVGSIAVATPERGTFAAARGTALRLSMLVLFGMAAAIGLAVALRASVVRSVTPIVETSRALGRGDLSARAAVRGDDELAELARGFNHMAERLEAGVVDLERRVTERTQQLQQLYSQSVEAAEARRQFFAAVSHEFRTPLFAIKANAELLLDPELRPTASEEVGEYVATIERATARLIDRVDELLSLARAESIVPDVVAVPVDLSALVLEVGAMLEGLGRSHGVTVEVVADEAVATVGDRDRLVEVVSNLVSNAVKYTPEGGRVDVEVLTAGEVSILRVSDTGVGIPPEAGDRVFEPYFRVAGSEPAGGHHATGLGLAVTKLIVEAHRGRIGHAPRAGGGTVFTVELPRR